jgi:arylsulfatase A
MDVVVMNYYNKLVLPFVFLLQTATVLSQKVILIVDVGMGFNDNEDIPNSGVYNNLPFSISDFTVAAADFNPSYAGFLTSELQLGTKPSDYLSTSNIHAIADKASIPTGHFGSWGFNRHPDASKYIITTDPKLALASAANFIANKSDYVVTIFMPPLSDSYIPDNSPMRDGNFGDNKVICYNNKPSSYAECSRFPYVIMMREKDKLLNDFIQGIDKSKIFITWAPVFGGVDPHTDALSAPKTFLRGGQFSLYHGGIGVLFRYSNGPFPKLKRNDANAIDLAPTLLSLYGLTMPKQDGINLFDLTATRTTPLRWYTNREAEGNCVNSSPAFAEQQIIDGKKIKVLYDADLKNDQAYAWNMGYEAQKLDIKFNIVYPRPTITIPGCVAPVATGIKRNFAALPKKDKFNPNIYVFLIDDAGWGDLSINSKRKGRNYPDTPNIDKLFESSVVFTDGHSAATICTPTRTAFTTARNPSNRVNPIRGIFAHTESGILENVRPPYPGAVGSSYNIFKHFKARGYKVCHYGKWHISDPRSKKTPVFFGVDPDCYKIHSGYAPPAQTYPFTSPYYQAHASEIITNDVMDALDRINGSQPVFMNIWHSMMHQPFRVEPGQLAPVGFDNTHNPYLIKSSEIFNRETPLQIYNGIFKILDANIGKVLDRINKNPGEDGSIIIFHMDNGAEDRALADTSVGDKGPFRGQKRSLYEGGHHVPTAIRWITKAGNVFKGSVAAPMGTYDFFPTFAGLSGSSIETIPGYKTLDGIDLAPCLLNDRCDYNRPLRWETPWPNRGDCLEAGGRFSIKWRSDLGNFSCIARSIIKGPININKLKDIRCYDAADPLQYTDIAPKSPKVVAEFKHLLSAWPNYDTKYFPPKIYNNPGAATNPNMRLNFLCN